MRAAAAARFSLSVFASRLRFCSCACVAFTASCMLTRPSPSASTATSAPALAAAAAHRPLRTAAPSLSAGRASGEWPSLSTGVTRESRARSIAASFSCAPLLRANEAL
eukprot:5282659-Pleurochrysis_carterae.AAC.2